MLLWVDNDPKHTSLDLCTGDHYILIFSYPIKSLHCLDLGWVFFVCLLVWVFLKLIFNYQLFSFPPAQAEVWKRLQSVPGYQTGGSHQWIKEHQRSFSHQRK